MRTFKKGFTLAEVLITLLIIGVIASIVIPNLIADSQNAELKVAWKKAYSEISQATQMIMANNGGTLIGVVANSSDLVNLYSNYMSVIKTGSGIWPDKISWLNNTLVTVNGGYAILLNDGIAIRFGTDASSTCSTVSYYNGNANNAGSLPACYTMIVDINGMKPPNTVGKDIFAIAALSNRIIPYGTSSGFECTSYGYGCSALYLYQ
jgi:prepilin-type N-terminal cleavage/methylation domain-containing protein